MLDPALLQSGLIAAMTPGFIPPPPAPTAPAETIAIAMAAAMDAYFKGALACSGLGPSLVFFPLLEDGMKTALDISGGAKTAAVAAGEWATAIHGYWDGALFGATGISLVPPKATLSGPLETLLGLVPSAFPAFIAGLVSEIDTWTKTITVTDAAVPPPSGCGPAPIM